MRTSATEGGGQAKQQAISTRGTATRFGRGTQNHFTSAFLLSSFQEPDIRMSNSWSTTIQQLPNRTGSLPGQPGTHLTLEYYPTRQQWWRAPDRRYTGRKLKPIIYLPPSKKLQMLSSRLRTRWKVSRTICCWISSGYGIKEVKVNRGVGGRQSEKLHSMDGDEKGEKCFRAGNNLNIWYQFPEKIKVMSKGKIKGESMENG